MSDPTASLLTFNSLNYTLARLINVPEILHASKTDFTRCLFSMKRARASGNEIILV